MSADHIYAMEPQVIDWWIATLVMGKPFPEERPNARDGAFNDIYDQWGGAWSVHFDSGDAEWGTYHPLPFSTDNNQMMVVIDVMRERDFWWSASYKVIRLREALLGPGYEVKFRCVRGGTRGDHVAMDSGLPRATAIAALLAMRGEEG